MGALTVLKFDMAAGATRALEVMRNLQEEHLIYIQDAATVTWPQGKRKPKTHQTQSLTGEGALWGSFWGLLFGLLFFMPLKNISLAIMISRDKRLPIRAQSGTIPTYLTFT